MELIYWVLLGMAVALVVTIFVAMYFIKKSKRLKEKIADAELVKSNRDQLIGVVQAKNDEIAWYQRDREQLIMELERVRCELRKSEDYAAEIGNAFMKAGLQSSSVPVPMQKEG